jgi:putative Mg2+ transporter-C (MgtC) family protein
MLENIIASTEFAFLGKIAFCMIAGFVIGLERESRKKDAGIGTHTLVITGAMLFTFLSQHIAPNDPSRIAAQVVSGIGFLGAGIILTEGANVRNLTTAASIWFAGAIGMAIGFGFYFVGLVATVVSVITPRIPHLEKMSPESKAEEV